MSTDADTEAGSPFHRGELEAQDRAGVRARIAQQGRSFIRDHMPDQHRAFFAELPYLIIGSADDRGLPWASVLTGAPGFATSPDPRSLHVAAQAMPGDPLADHLAPGGEIGVLGIQLHTRRRNRMNGRIASIDATGFTIVVDQSFGNCPQYIQRRAATPASRTTMAGGTVHRSRGLGEAERALIAAADTLFIASRHRESDGSPREGVDVSHRGGKPGFVKVEDDGAVVFPDFSGNFFFNTIGNLILDPRAGLLFVDFDGGDVVQLSGAAEIVWDGPEVEAFQGAERLIRVRPEAVVRIEAALPFRWEFQEVSPILDRTGSWEEAARTLAIAEQRNAYLPYRVVRMEDESETVRSFYLEPDGPHGLVPFEPGQFLPIRLTIPGHDQPVLRTYSLSDAPNGRYYRLSVKREPRGTASRFLHRTLEVGSRIEAMAPRGGFALDGGSARPVLLISGGVGLTPMVSMLNHLVREGERTRVFRPVWFVHGARNGREHALGGHVRDLAARFDSVTAHIRYSRPDPADREGRDHDSTGHIDADLLRSLLPLDDYEAYLCGPPEFMKAVYRALRQLGLARERIHYEFFGPSSVLDEADQAGAAPDRVDRVQAEAPVEVTFQTTGLTATWTPGAGSLLELAEANGIDAPYSCRTGLCGSCAAPVVSGEVAYTDAPSASCGGGDALICSAVPAKESADGGVVLDL